MEDQKQAQNNQQINNSSQKIATLQQIPQNQSKGKINWRVISIVIFFLLLTGSLTTYFLLKKNDKKDIPKYQLTPKLVTPTGTKQEEPITVSNWETYSNKNYGFSFKYPREYQLSENLKNRKPSERMEFGLSLDQYTLDTQQPTITLMIQRGTFAMQAILQQIRSQSIEKNYGEIDYLNEDKYILIHDESKVINGITFTKLERFIPKNAPLRFHTEYYTKIEGNTIIIVAEYNDKFKDREAGDIDGIIKTLKFHQQSKTSELKPLDNVWNLYSNQDYGFSIKVPKEVADAPCEWSREKGDHSYRINWGKYGSISVPIKVLEDDNKIYITEEWVYQLTGETKENGKSFYSNCEKRETDLELLGYENRFPLEKGKWLLKPFTWEITTKRVKNDKEINFFIKDYFGEGCELGEKKESSHPGVLVLEINGYYNEKTNEINPNCMLNYMYVLRYIPKTKTVFAWSGGQEATFQVSDRDKGLFKEPIYDNEMVESFAVVEQ